MSDQQLACAFLVALLVTALPVSAQDDVDLFDMDFGAFMEMKVSVASVGPEGIAETPAIVSSYSVAELEKMGLRSLRDVLSIVPGVFIQSSNIPMDSIMVRGISETFNQKILLLIDDVPYWGASHSQIPLLGIPLEAIDHIEVIRGPGAVIHGTNASAGVIKVVTKKATAGNSVVVTGGSHGLANGSAFVSYPLSDSVDLSVGLEVEREDGYRGYFENSVTVPWLADDQETSGYTREKMERTSAIAKLTAGNLNVLTQFFDSLETGSLGAAPTHPSKPAEGESNGYLLHASYTWDFEQATVRAYSDYNVAYTEAYEVDYFGPGGERRVQFDNNGGDNYRWRSGVTGTYEITEQLSGFLGSEYEYRSTGNYDLLIDGAPVLRQLARQELDEVSLFGQLDYSAGDFRYLLGGRYTDNERAGDSVSPRAAVVYSIDEIHSIKALFSEGFTSPNFLQTGVDLPFIVGNEDLIAETVRTYDLAYTHSGSHSLFVINAYRLEARDFITRVPSGTGPVTFANSTDFERHGLELDLQHRIEEFTGFLGASYIREGNDTDVDDAEAAHAPEFTWNVAGHYDMGGGHGIGSSLRFVGPRLGVGDYMLWNVDYQYSTHGVEGFVTVRNILSESAFSRDVAGFSPEPVPVSDPELNFLVGVRFSF